MGRESEFVWVLLQPVSKQRIVCLFIYFFIFGEGYFGAWGLKRLERESIEDLDRTKTLRV